MTTPPVVTFPASTTPQNPDRSNWLIVFGIFELFMALAVFGLLAILLLSLLVTTGIPGHAATPWRMMLQVVLSYAGICVFFVVMGIGSIQARRWARALMEAVSWLWLVSGAAGVLAYAFILPRMLKHAGGPGIPQNVALIMTVIMLIFMVGILVVLPFIMLMFYRARSVKATCERRDTVVRWTDRLPLPMLILLVMLATGTISFLVMAFTMPYLAFFGRFVTGWPAMLACFAFSGWWAYLAWGTHRLRISSWWLTISTLILFGVSSAATFLRGDATRMYSEMGLPTEQAAMSAAILKSPVLVGLMIAGMLAFAGFLIYVRRYYCAALTETKS